MNGLRGPPGFAEVDVGIKGPDISCVMRKTADPDVQQILFGPRQSVGSHGDMRDARRVTDIGKIVTPRAMGCLNNRHMNIWLAKPIRDRLAGEEDTRFPSNRV